jgi:hypothetical protein
MNKLLESIILNEESPITFSEKEKEEGRRRYWDLCKETDLKCRYDRAKAFEEAKHIYF